MGELFCDLKSVGTGLDENGMTYPMLKSGGYDTDNGCHLSEIELDGDWWMALDYSDKNRIRDFLSVEVDWMTQLLHCIDKTEE